MKVCVDRTKAALTESMLIQKKVKISKNDSSTGDSTALCEDQGYISEFEDSKLPPVLVPTLKKKRSLKSSNENIGRSQNVKKRSSSSKQSSDCDDSFKSLQSLL